MHSRAARPGDAETIAGIYNEGIEERIATFETLRVWPVRYEHGSKMGIPSSSWKTVGP